MQVTQEDGGRLNAFAKEPRMVVIEEDEATAPNRLLLFGGLKGAEGIRQQVAAIGDHLQLHKGVVLLAGEFGQLAAEPGHPDRLLGGGAAGGVGQHPDAAPIDRLHQAAMAGSLALHPSHRHGHDLAAAGHQAGLHHRQGGVFAGARHQAAAEASAADLERCFHGRRVGRWAPAGGCRCRGDRRCAGRRSVRFQDRGSQGAQHP